MLKGGSRGFGVGSGGLLLLALLDVLSGDLEFFLGFDPRQARLGVGLLLAFIGRLDRLFLVDRREAGFENSLIGVVLGCPPAPGLRSVKAIRRSLIACCDRTCSRATFSAV